jgi:hypothetical protein
LVIPVDLMVPSIRFAGPEADRVVGEPAISVQGEALDERAAVLVGARRGQEPSRQARQVLLDRVGLGAGELVGVVVAGLVTLAGEDLFDATEELPGDLDDVLGGRRRERDEGNASVFGAREDAVAKERVEVEVQRHERAEPLDRRDGADVR